MSHRAPCLLALTSLLLACTPQPPVMATLQVPSFRVHDQPEITRDGLTVTLRPITDDAVRAFPQIYKTVTFTASENNLLTGKPEPVQRRAEVSILPLPAFQIRVTNRSGHVLRFTQVVFRLQDQAGRTYPLYTGTSEIVPWLENMWITTPGFGKEVADQVMPQLTPALTGLSLLGRNTEMLNGDEYTGFLVFNVGINNMKDYEAFMSSVERLTLRLAEMPVGVSDAGAVTRTTEFTFILNKVTAPLRVKCPPGTTQPSIATCQKEA